MKVVALHEGNKRESVFCNNTTTLLTDPKKDVVESFFVCNFKNEICLRKWIEPFRENISHFTLSDFLFCSLVVVVNEGLISFWHFLPNKNIVFKWANNEKNEEVSSYESLVLELLSLLTLQNIFYRCMISRCCKHQQQKCHILDENLMTSLWHFEDDTWMSNWK